MGLRRRGRGGDKSRKEASNKTIRFLSFKPIEN